MTVTSRLKDDSGAASPVEIDKAIGEKDSSSPVGSAEGDVDLLIENLEKVIYYLTDTYVNK